MKARRFVLSTALLAAACATDPSNDRASALEAATKRPNVLLIVTDDQGYGDLGAHGNGMIRTPNLDALHASSVRLTDFHVDPTCSPTRSALMTGRYSSRTGVWHTIMGRSLMDGAEETMAEVLQDAGYRTGMFGKWHLGDNAPLRPQDQGFEHVVWHHGGGVGQGPDYWGNDYFDDTYEVNGEWRPFQGYCTDVWFREAQAFIEQESDEPFFAYLATNAPHGPFLVDPSYAERYEAMGVPSTMAKFYGMIENIDENVGRLRAQLEQLGIADNTILVFMTDNGTAAGHAARAKEEGDWRGYRAGMRGNKGSEYEGGHRVPCFVHWPDGGIVGGRDIDALTAHVDLLPTVAELCSGAPSGTLPLDGASLAGALRGDAPAPHDRTLFVHSQRINTPKRWRKTAVMTERWRLVNQTELYDIQSDPAQETNVADLEPEVVARLESRYDAWWESLAETHARTVHIEVGGAEDVTNLTSHDWHTQSGGTPWHQNHVTNGTVGNGYWALDVARAGRYEVELLRWPAHLERAGGVTYASLRFSAAAGGGASLERAVDVNDVSTRFEVQLGAGPTRLTTTLRGPDRDEHGAYFVRLRRIGG